tara:strand:- start:424 stop:696 length:273 start_codon:yes stop_codon:yes gene_type:complete
MTTMNIPENLSVTQLMELRALIKGSLTPAQIRAATIKKYHDSDKGRAKRNAASKRYYQRKRKEKMEAALSNQIAEAEEKLNALKSKYSQL